MADITRMLILGSVLLAAAAVHGDDSLRVLTEDTATPPDHMLEAELLSEFDTAWKVRAERYASIHTPADVDAYQQRLRAAFMENLGGLPERTPLNARIVGEGEGEGFRYQKIIYESRPQFFVTAVLFLPTSDPPYPGVLVPCGHSATGKAEEAYQRVCILLARHGMAALCYDPIGQGERHQVLDAHGKPVITGVQEHTLLGQSCILLGTSAATVRIWDGIRGIDYLCSRNDIRADRIGCTGNSGGGTLTSYIGALDDRVECSAPSCYITSIPELLSANGPQDAEQNIHAALRFGMGHADYLILRAPKPTLVCAATHDFFPIAGTWDSFRQAKRIYTRLGAAERLDLVETDAEHGFTRRLREGAVQWMQRWLLGRDADVVEPEFDVLTPEQMQCTPAGEVLLLDGARSVVDLNKAHAAELSETRRARWSAMDDDERVARIRETASIRALEAIPELSATMVKSFTRDGMRVNAWKLKYWDNLVLPVLEVLPDRDATGTVLFLHDEGKQVGMDPGGQIESWVKAGRRVWAIDLSGIGETKPHMRYPGWEPRFGAAWQHYFLAYLLDRSLVGLRAEDVLASARYLTGKSHESVSKLHLVAHGACTVPALHAVALHPELFDRVTLSGGLQSWENVVNLHIRERQLENTVHGALRAYDLTDLAEMVSAKMELTWEAPLDSPEHVEFRSLSSSHDALRRRTLTHFASAAFLKPREGEVDPQLIRSAPLIMQEAASAEAFRDFGRVRRDGSASGAIVSGRWAVYHWEDGVDIQGRDHRRLNYLWFYPATDDHSQPHARGYRMILDEQNFPIVWQPLDDLTSGRALYVSKSLESAASEAHGPAKPGRTFAIETALAARPDVYVARVLDDGPMPMGPYVYLNDRLDITTILCRCMPAQVDGFVVNDYYDLVPLDSLDALNLSPDLRRQIEMDTILEPIDLNTALRWP